MRGWQRSALVGAACGLALAARAQESAEGLEFLFESEETDGAVENIAVGEAPSPDVGAPESGVVQLEEVIVTSQKFEQTLREVPASVSVIDGDFITKAKVQTVNDINGYTPSTQIRVVPFAGEVRIRGYGTPPSNLGFEPSVGTIVDDVYYGRTTFLSAIMFDIDRFEIVRGPQGALFGKNTIAGVLNVTTRQAEPFLAGDVMVTALDLDTRDIRVGVSAPLSDTIGLRFSATNSADEGFYYNTYLSRPEGDIRAVSSRFKFQWEPSDRFKLRASVFLSDQAANSNLFQLAQVTGPMLEYLRGYDPEVEADPSNDRLSSNVDAYADNTLYGGQFNLDYDITDSLSFHSITAYAGFELAERSLDFDASPAPFLALRQDDPSPYDQYSQEFRLVGTLGAGLGTRRSEYIVGLYGFYSDYFVNDKVVLEDVGAAAGYIAAARLGGATGDSGGPVGNLLGRLLSLLGDLSPDTLPGTSETAYLTLDQSTLSYAAFGQITSWLTDDFAVILGLRVGREEKEGHFVSDSDGAIFLPAVTGQSDHDSYREREESEASPKVGVKYDVNDQISTYAIWARGYKSGGFNALPLSDENLEFGPETADSYEVGVKTRFFGGTLQSNLAVYLTEFDNLQVSAFTGTTFQVLNAAAARSQGFEVDLNWLSPWPGTEIRASAGYNDAYYLSYTDAPAPASSNEDSQDLTGESLSLAPKWTASLTPTVGLPGFFSDTWGFQIGLDYLFTSERYLDVDRDPVTLQPDTHVLNARISAGSIDGRWSFTFGAQNLTDEIIQGQITDVPAAPGNYQSVRLSRGTRYFGLLRFQF